MKKNCNNHDAKAASSVTIMSTSSPIRHLKWLGSIQTVQLSQLSLFWVNGHRCVIKIQERTVPHAQNLIVGTDYVVALVAGIWALLHHLLLKNCCLNPLSCTTTHLAWVTAWELNCAHKWFSMLSSSDGMPWICSFESILQGFQLRTTSQVVRIKK